MSIKKLNKHYFCVRHAKAIQPQTLPARTENYWRQAVIFNLYYANQEQQRGQRTKPFSLQSGHLLSCPSSSSKYFLLPSQCEQGKKRISPHPSHIYPGGLRGSPLSNFDNSPISFNCLITSDPPMYLPLIKTCGKFTFFWSKTFCSSFLNALSIEISLSSILTW